jgi:hypothetical protein
MVGTMAPPGTNTSSPTANGGIIEPTDGESPSDDTFLTDAPLAPRAAGAADPFTSTTPPAGGPPPRAAALANSSAATADAPALDYYYDTPPNGAG